MLDQHKGMSSHLLLHEELLREHLLLQLLLLQGLQGLVLRMQEMEDSQQCS